MAVTLKPDYLDTLTTGKHTVTIKYTDGEAEGTFIIEEKPADNADKDTASPATNDNSNPALWAWLVAAAGVSLAGITIYRRRKTQ